MAIAAFLAALATQDLPAISVLDAVTEGLSSTQVEIIGDAVRDTVAASGRYRVQDRGTMREILSQQQLNESELCDQSCAVLQGQLLQVRYLVSSTIKRAEDLTTIAVRMIDAETGQILRTASGSSRGRLDEVVPLAEELTRTVLGETAAKPPPAPPPPAPAPPPPEPPPPPGKRSLSIYDLVSYTGASFGLSFPATGILGVTLEAGWPHFCLRAGAGFIAAGASARLSTGWFGAGGYLEGGAAALTFGEGANYIVYGLAGWRWRAHPEGVFFQFALGGGRGYGRNVTPFMPAVQIELGGAG